MIPKKISAASGKYLEIAWDNGESDKIKITDLRRYCPCAYCAADRESHGKNYIPLYSGSQIQIEKIEIVGHYALSIKWKDGHNTGIFEFQQLRKLNSGE